MNQPSISHQPADADRVADISRLVRRVCLLREQGDLAGARDIESTRLADAVRALREAAGPDALTDSALQAIFSVERERVADAAALCELLLPNLTASIPTVSLRGPESPRALSPIPSNRETATTAGSPEIPDLLDAMLAAERTGRRISQNTRSKT